MNSKIFFPYTNTIIIYVHTNLTKNKESCIGKLIDSELSGQVAHQTRAGKETEAAIKSQRKGVVKNDHLSS